MRYRYPKVLAYRVLGIDIDPALHPIRLMPHIQNASFIVYLAVENPEENVQSNEEMAQDEVKSRAEVQKVEPK